MKGVGEMLVCTHKRKAQQHMGEEMGTDGEIRNIHRGAKGKCRETGGRWRREMGGGDE